MTEDRRQAITVLTDVLREKHARIRQLQDECRVIQRSITFLQMSNDGDPYDRRQETCTKGHG